MNNRDLQINFFGTGSAFNYNLGSNSAYINTLNNFIFVDAGEGILHKLDKLNPKEYVGKKVVFIITHLHPDHVASLGNLIYWFYFKHDIKPIVYFAGANLELLLKIQGVSKEFYEYVQSVPMVENDLVDLNFVYYPTSHYESLDCFGILFKNHDKSIYYSGDSNLIPSNILDMFLLDKIDYIYQDVTSLNYENNPHLYLGKLETLIPEPYRKRVYCMHMDNSFKEEVAINLGFNVTKSIFNEK